MSTGINSVEMELLTRFFARRLFMKSTLIIGMTLGLLSTASLLYASNIEFNPQKEHYLLPIKLGSYFGIASALCISTLAVTSIVQSNFLVNFRILRFQLKSILFTVLFSTFLVFSATLHNYNYKATSDVEDYKRIEEDAINLRGEQVKLDEELRIIELTENKSTVEQFLILRRFDTFEGMGVYDAVKGFTATKCVVIGDENDLHPGLMYRIPVIPDGQKAYKVHYQESIGGYESTEYVDTFKQVKLGEKRVEALTRLNEIKNKLVSLKSEQDILFHKIGGDSSILFSASSQVRDFHDMAIKWMTS